MPKSSLPKGVHRVRRKIVSGVRYHFYAWRGGPKFWEGTVASPNEPEFFHAFAECGKPTKPSEFLTSQLVDDFLSSASLPKAERSKADGVDSSCSTRRRNAPYCSCLSLL